VFTAKDGTEVNSCIDAYYVPAAKERLVSHFFKKKKGIFGTFNGDEGKFVPNLNDHPVL
jgi:hypothetical protein